MEVKVKFNDINVKEEKEKTLVKILMLKGEKGDTVSAEWGTISGTLSEQADLKDALDSKVSQTDFEQALNLKANQSDLNTTNQNVSYLQTKVNLKPYYFDTIYDLKNANLKNGDYAETLGYYEKNDGGSGKYLIRSKSNSDVEDEGHIHFINNNLVAELQYNNAINYNQFGAYGDGENDDFQYLKKTHDFANLYNLNVEGVAKSTYYIGEIDEQILVKTNTDLKNAHFIIDDEIINHSKREIPIYHICPSENDIYLPANTISSLNKFQKNIPELQGYGDKLVYVVNSNKRVYIRRGLNTGSSDLQDVFRINKDGDVLDDIIWDFEQITTLTLKHIDKEFIYFKNGIFTTKVNVVDSYSYYHRNIRCSRSNVNISGIKHFISGEDDTLVSSPYQGFIYTFYTTNVFINDCTLSGHKTYVDSTTTANKGNYDIQNRSSIDIFMSNINQSNSITDTTLWGIHTSNFSKNLYFENCILSRIDVHRGLYNISIKNCKLGRQGIKLIGSGYALIEDTEVYNCDFFVELREDYGATWNGTLEINRCSLHTNDSSTNEKKLISCYHQFDWDYGYKCYLPNLIIDDFTFDSNSKNKCWLLFTRDYSEFETSIDYSKSYEENAENDIYPHIMSKFIKLNNLKTIRDADYYLFSNNEIENFYCEDTGNTVNRNNLNNSFATNTDFIFNLEIYINKVKLKDLTNESYDAARCSLWEKAAFKAVDCTNTYRVVGRITIKNQKDLYLGLSGRAIYLKVINSSIRMMRAGYSGLYAFFDIENCIIKYNYSTTPSSNNPCFNVTGYTYMLNKCKFELQNGLTLSDIYNIEDPFVKLSLSTSNWLRLGSVYKNNTFWAGINSEIPLISKFQELREIYGCSNDIFYNNETMKYIPRRIGTTSNRPVQGTSTGYIIPTGFVYYDTDLSKPIIWNGSGWVDYAGTSV